MQLKATNTARPDATTTGYSRIALTIFQATLSLFLSRDMVELLS
jgi:hypothetical protein